MCLLQQSLEETNNKNIFSCINTSDSSWLNGKIKSYYMLKTYKIDWFIELEILMFCLEVLFKLINVQCSGSWTRKAQLVEYQARDLKVQGSNPDSGSNFSLGIWYCNFHKEKIIFFFLLNNLIWKIISNDAWAMK